MQTRLSLSRLLGYKDFFPNHTPRDKEYYAERIGSEKLKQFSAHFLSFSRLGNTKTVEQLIAEWYTFNDEHRFYDSPAYYETISSYERIRRFHKEQDHIISVESLLNFFLWLQQHPGLPNTRDADASITIDLFDLNLLFNNDVLDNYQKAVSIVEPLKDGRHLQRLTLAMSFSQSDFINIDYQQLLYCQFYKAMRLLEYMEATPKYQPLFSHLLSYFEIESKEHYIRGIGLATLLSLKDKQGWNVLVVEHNGNYDASCSFLDKIAVTPDYDVSDGEDDYRPLRARPIEKIGQGQYRIIFDLFLLKKMYNGLLFILSEMVRHKPDILTGTFFGNIRLDFSEEVLLYEVMQKIYNLPDIVTYTGNQLKATLDREPDYYVRRGNTIMLLESKDFFMPGDIKLSYDFIQIEAELRKDGRLGKAVKQLARNVRRVFAMEFPDNSYDATNVNIFPVIITHDSLYNCAGLNYWVYYWLEKEFPEEKMPGLQPITIVCIDTLIQFEKSFATGKLDLINLLFKFHEVVNFKAENLKDIGQYAYQSCVPFSEFVSEMAEHSNITPDIQSLNLLLQKFNID